MKAIRREYIYESIDKKKGPLKFNIKFSYFRQHEVDNNRFRIHTIMDDLYATNFILKSNSNPSDRLISKLLKVSSINFSRLLHGEINLSVDMLIKIAWFCGVSVDRIIRIEQELGFIEKRRDLVDYKNITEVSQFDYHYF